MMDGVEVGRVNVAARACGIANRAFELGIAYAQQRETFGKPIAEHQAILFRLAEMATKVETAHAMMVRAARTKDSGERNDVEAGMAKMLASEYCNEVVEDSFRIHGGYGYSKEYEIERLYREAAFMLIGEGTSDIQKMIIGRSLLKDYKLPRAADRGRTMRAGRTRDAPQRLYLHVGLPKSGSTFLQSVLGGNRAALKEHGYIYPYVRQEGMFHAAVEMAGTPQRWGLAPEEVAGTFARLLRRGRRLGGTRRHQPRDLRRRRRRTDRGHRRAAGGLRGPRRGHRPRPRPHHDRRVAGEGQERPPPLLRRVRRRHPRATARAARRADAAAFWPTQNLASLLERWQALAPPERIHVVRARRRGAGPGLLWTRFADALELDPDVVDLSEVPVRNESLGAAQIGLLRAGPGGAGRPARAAVALARLQALVRPDGAQPGEVGQAGHAPRRRAAARGGLRAVDRAVGAGGFAVHGDLAELLPGRSGTPRPAP